MSISIKRLSLLLVSMAVALCAAGTAYAAPDAGSPEQSSAAESSETQPDYIIPPSEDPTQPVIQLDPPVISCSDMPEANYVSVHIYAPAGVQLSQNDRIVYRFDNDELWNQYVSSIEVRRNCDIHSLIVYADGTRSHEASVTISSIDMTPPTAPTVKADLKTWIKDRLTVELEPGTDQQSGYLRSEYRIGADGQWTEYTAKFDVTQNCVLFVRGVDKAGNYSEEANVKISNFDTAAPDMTGAGVILSSSSGFAASESNTFSKIFKGDVSFTVSGIRDDESGVAYYEYQAAGSTSNLSEAGWKRSELKDSPVIKGDFCGYVFVRAVDKVGNVSSNLTSEGFIIDTTPPAISDISLTPSTLTDGRVTIKFSVTDNSQISEITVNSAYVGAYATSYTVYRNGDYVIRAVDAAGNVSSRGVTVNNINSTPFTLVNTFQSLNESNFTPSTWAEAKAAATALQGQLTVGASEDQISASYERLLAAMEALVTKGDGTASIALIGRINTDYNKDNYTESSWNAVEQRMEELTRLLYEPERTQEQVDSARRSLENALIDLVPRGSFDSLDALIVQCGALDPADYDKLKYSELQEALEKAKSLPRTDSAQEEIDEAYQRLLTAMVELKDTPKKEGFNFTLVFFVILALLIIAVGTALFIMNRRMKQEKDGELTDSDGIEDGDGGYDPAPPYDYLFAENEPEHSVGDLYFTDEADEEELHDVRDMSGEHNESSEQEDDGDRRSSDEDGQQVSLPEPEGEEYIGGKKRRS